MKGLAVGRDETVSRKCDSPGSDPEMWCSQQKICFTCEFSSKKSPATSGT